MSSLLAINITFVSYKWHSLVRSSIKKPVFGKIFAQMFEISVCNDIYNENINNSYYTVEI